MTPPWQTVLRSVMHQGAGGPPAIHAVLLRSVAVLVPGLSSATAVPAPSLKRQYATSPGSAPVSSYRIMACTSLAVRTTFHSRTSSSPPSKHW